MADDTRETLPCAQQGNPRTGGNATSFLSTAVRRAITAAGEEIPAPIVCSHADVGGRGTGPRQRTVGHHGTHAAPGLHPVHIAPDGPCHGIADLAIVDCGVIVVAGVPQSRPSIGQRQYFPFAGGDQRRGSLVAAISTGAVGVVDSLSGSRD